MEHHLHINEHIEQKVDTVQLENLGIKLVIDYDMQDYNSLLVVMKIAEMIVIA